MGVNAGALRAVADAMEAGHAPYAPRLCGVDMENIYYEDADCGAVGCVIGWTLATLDPDALVWLRRPSNPDAGQDAAARAAELLGLDVRQVGDEGWTQMQRTFFSNYRAPAEIVIENLRHMAAHDGEPLPEWLRRQWG